VTRAKEATDFRDCGAPYVCTDCETGLGWTGWKSVRRSLIGKAGHSTRSTKELACQTAAAAKWMCKNHGFDDRYRSVAETMARN
jgi:hypothetical protein